jgi:branched-chain amino acid transport system permease protein
VDLALSILFVGMAYGMILYIISVGLSVTMGLLGVANLAHGVFAMAGGYIIFELLHRGLMPFWASLIVTAALVGAGSLIIERLIFVRVYKASELDQVLLSIGLIFVASAVAYFISGPIPRTIAVPQSLHGNVQIGWRDFPRYRIFLILLGITTFLTLWVGIERTNFGARVRAAVDNRGMAESIGINTKRLFSLIFVLGSALAGIGGAVGADMIGITPGYPLEQLTYFLIVVSVGGLGTVTGPFFAALLLGIGDSTCKILAPEFGAFFVYVAIFVVLLAFPKGLFSRE